MRRQFLLLGGLAAAVAAFQATTPQPTPTASLGHRVRQLTSQDVTGRDSLAKPTKQTPAQPAVRPASKLELALRPLPLGLEQLHLHARADRRRVKYGRHRWVVLG